MNNKGELFDKETINYITELVENKSYLLINQKDFKEKDKMLSLCMENFENDLSEEKKEKFNSIIKLMYQIEEYYLTLAYSLGTKYGKNIEKM